MSNFFEKLKFSASIFTKSKFLLFSFHFFAILIAVVDVSTPIACPAFPTFFWICFVTTPVPHATSNTTSFLLIFTNSINFFVL